MTSKPVAPPPVAGNEWLAKIAALESQINDLKTHAVGAVAATSTSPPLNAAPHPTSTSEADIAAAAAAATAAAISAVAAATRRANTNSNAAAATVAGATTAPATGASATGSIPVISLLPPAIVTGGSGVPAASSVVLPPTATVQPASTFTDRSKKRCVVNNCVNAAVKRGYCASHSGYAVLTPGGSGTTPTHKDEDGKTSKRDFGMGSSGNLNVPALPLNASPGSSGSSGGHRRHHHHSSHNTKPPLNIAHSLDSIAKYHFQRNDLATLVAQNLPRAEFYTSVRQYLREQYAKRGITIGDDILQELATSLADLYSSQSQYRSLLTVTSSFNRDITLTESIGNIVSQLSVVLSAERVTLFFVDHNERRLHTVYDSDTPLSARSAGAAARARAASLSAASGGANALIASANTTAPTANATPTAATATTPAAATATPTAGAAAAASSGKPGDASSSSSSVGAASFSLDDGVLGYVARTGQSLNVKDATQPLVLPAQPVPSAAAAAAAAASGSAPPPAASSGAAAPVLTLNVSKWDERTGRQTRNLLAVPVEDPRTGSVIAVIQAVNKQNEPVVTPTATPAPTAAGASAPSIAVVAAGPPFTDSDQAVLNFVAVFAGQTIQNAKLYDEAVKRRKAQETLLHMFELISADVSSVGGVEHVLHAIIDTAYQLVEVDRISLFVLDDPGKGDLVCRVSKDSSVRGLRVPVGPTSVVGYAAATGHVVNLNVNDLSNGGGGVAGAGVDRKFTIDPTVDRLSGSGAPPMSAAALASVAAASGGVLPPVPAARVTRNMLTLPIMDTTTDPASQHSHHHHHSDKQHRSKSKRLSPVVASATAPPPVDANQPKALAVIQVINKRDGSFTAEDEALMTSLARGAGVLLRKAQVHEQLVYTQRRTQALLTVLKASERENDVEGVIDTILQVAYDILQAERMALFFVDHVRKDLYCVRSPDAQGFSLPITSGIGGWVASNGVGANVSDVYADPRFDSSFDKITGNKTKSLLCLPIKDSTGKTVAVLQAVNKIVSRSDWEFDQQIHHRVQHTNEHHIPLVQTAQAVAAGIDPALIAKHQPVVVPHPHPHNAAAGGATAIPGIVAPLPSYFGTSTNSTGGGLASPNSGGASPHRRTQSQVYTSRPLTDSQVPSTTAVASSADQKYVNDPKAQTLPVPAGSSGSSKDPKSDSSKRGLAERRKFRSSVDATSSMLGRVGASDMRRPLRGVHDSSTVVGASFSAADEELMAGFCIEIGGTLRRFMTAVLLERSSIGEDVRLNSLLENYGHHDVNIVASIDIAIRKEKLPPKTPGGGSNGPNAGDAKSTAVAPANGAAPPQLTVAGSTSSSTGSPVNGDSDSPPHSPTHATAAAAAAAARSSWPAQISLTPGFSYSEMIGSLCRLDFDCWSYTEDQLMIGCYYMMQDFNIMRAFRVSDGVMQNFLMSIRYRYRKVPYHNFYHGFSVMQYSYIVLKTTNARSCFEDVDTFGLLVGSLAHDVDHPGNNNQFEINTNSRLALKYNDISVLENHHAFTLFQILQQPASNIIAQLSADGSRTIRKRMIKGILATDMAGHFELCKRIDQLLAAKINVAQPTTPGPVAPAPAAPAPATATTAPAAGAAATASGTSTPTPAPSSTNIHFDIKSEADRQFLFDIIIHSADLQSIVVPVSIAKEWGRRVVAEFNAQAIEEERRGLAVAEFMRGMDNPQNVGKSQRGFVDFVCAPMFAKLAQIFPPLQPCLVNLAGVRAYYDGLANTPPPQATAAAAKPAATTTAAAVAPAKK